MFIITKTKAGWAVQNSKTYVVVTTYKSQDEARATAAKLNK